MNAPTMANLLTFEQWITAYGYVSEDDGWWISNDSDDRLEIQTLDDVFRLDDDLAAVLHVRLMAWRGSPLHMHALGVLVLDRLS